MIETAPIHYISQFLAVFLLKFIILKVMEYFLHKLFIIRSFDFFYSTENLYFIKANINILSLVFAYLCFDPKENFMKQLLLEFINLGL